MKIEYLADHKDFIPIIAKWDYDEWGEIKNKDFEEIKNKYFHRAVKNKIPFVLVAFENDNVVGTISILKVSIIVNHIKPRPNYTPWIGSLYVRKDYRKKGIGSALVKKALQEIKKMNIYKIYLYTELKNIKFYQYQGWNIINKLKFHNEKVVIMSYEFI